MRNLQILIGLLGLAACKCEPRSATAQPRTPDAPSTPRSVAATAPSTVTLPAGFEQRYVPANGQRIHLVVGGHGEPILLIHGWPETWYEWRKVMPQLANHYTVVAPDMRGFGDSSRPESGYDKKTLAEDLYQVSQALGFQRVTLVGHDWGGPVAYAYAAHHRDAVKALVVVEGRPEGPWTTDKDPFWFFGFQRIPGYAERVVAGHEREYLAWFYRDPRLSHGAIDAQAIEEYLRSYASPAGIKAGCELYRAIETDIADNALTAQLPLTLPVLAVGAEGGAGAAVAAAMKHVATNVEELKLDGVAHFVPEERPELLAQAIAGFVQKSSAPP